MCNGKAPELEEATSFVGRWMDILRPGYDRIDKSASEADQLRALEMQSVLVSLENLMTFPFVTEAGEDGELTLHGLWTDISAGALLQYEPKSREFSEV